MRCIARIEFADKPRVRYLVTAVPIKIMIDVASSEAVLPYIALKVEDGGVLGWPVYRCLAKTATIERTLLQE